VVEAYLFDDYPEIAGFRFPTSYLALIKVGLPNIEPWGWLGEYKNSSVFWADTLRNQFPERRLVPFAKDGGSDDVACFDRTDDSGDPKVLLIHGFCSPGWEFRGEWENFEMWLKEIEQISAEFRSENRQFWFDSMESISKSLGKSLCDATAVRQRFACFVASEFAVRKVGITSPSVELTLNLIKSSQPISVELYHDLSAMKNRLDSAYYALKKAADNGYDTTGEWKRAFSQVRAVASLSSAVLSTFENEETFDRCSEAIYEASKSVDCNEELLAIVLSALGQQD
jgi:hypothetical protein